ncbi:hypothetical protein SUGI_0974250 [Cryptomeria japonica]|nr:hypothetical protein SUGI_0974250 [Cryptomeria japonica]
MAKQDDRWQVELATRSKVVVDSLVLKCPLVLGDCQTFVDLCVIYLGSYDVVLGMDWLGSHQVQIDCRGKRVQWKDDSGKSVEIVSIQRPISLRMISTMQMKRCVCKGCQLFVVRVKDMDGEVSLGDLLQQHPILQEFANVFPSEIPGMPPQRDIDFRIDLVPGAEPISKAPYRMTTQELDELRVQLKELLVKGFIHPSVSPWGALVLFVKKKDGSL